MSDRAADHHLHADRRGAAAGDLRLPADRPHLHRRRPASTSKTSDISVAARILAEFPDYLTEEQRVPDNLADLGELTQLPDTNIIKLPNISASVPQLLAAIKELQGQGLRDSGLSRRAEDRRGKGDQARATRKCLGSAVNPVLREGNSDRRAPKAVKEYARKHPHSMGEWSQASRTHVATMKHGDFYHGEKSMTLDQARNVQDGAGDQERRDDRAQARRCRCDDGDDHRQHVHEQEGAVRLLRGADARTRYKTGVMFSLHVKATMMKVSHPIVFGHAVKIFYKDAFAKHQKLFDELGVNVNNGLADLYDKIESLPASQRDEIIRDLHACHEHRPELAMVDSAKGITNFHSPSDVIVDASMPAMIRAGGKMYGADGRPKDTKAVNPESHLLPHLPGDHQLLQDQRPVRPDDHGHRPQRRPDGAAGRGVRLARQDLRDPRGRRRQHRRPRHRRSAADAERRGGRHLAHVPSSRTRRSATGSSWPSPGRATPACRWCSGWTRTVRTRTSCSRRSTTYLKDHDTDGPRHPDHVAGARHAVHARARDPRAGHHRRDRQHPARLPDRPVPDPGAGHQRQDAVDRAADGRRRHVRDGRGRFGAQARAAAGRGEPPALGFARRIPRAGASAWKTWASRPATSKAKILAKTLDAATGKLLDNNKNPSRKTGELDNRGSQFYLAHVLGAGARRADRGRGAGRALRAAGQDAGRERGRRSSPNSPRCRASRWTSAATTSPDSEKTTAVMRPSKTFNAALEAAQG